MIEYGEHSYCADWHAIAHYGLVKVTFGKFCSVGSGLKIISGQHPIIEHRELISQYPFKEQFGWDYPASKMGGRVTVGNDVWIGTDVTIGEGVTIGDGAIIGACAVVFSDVEPYTTVAGNPAKVIGTRQDPHIKWWDLDLEEIQELMETYK